jgi:glycosyltransferase involved in cell wall biosynthesis
MKIILHLHPNGKYANKFITPLRDSERRYGYSSLMINSMYSEPTDSQINISFSKSNILKLPFNLIIFFLYLYRIRPDIVFVHNSTSAVLPLLICKLLRVKKRIYFNHGIPFIAYRGILKKILYNLEILNCLLCTEIITVSYAMKKILFKITSKKITIINNGSACGVKLEYPFSNKEEKQSLRNNMAFRSVDRIFLFVGRPSKRKGFYDVINLWNKHLKLNLNFKLILLGIEKSDLLKLCKEIPNNIFPMSFEKNPEKFFLISDYLLVTSYHEGLNYAVIEAMMSKTIVISNKIIGVTELIKNDINGFLINNNNYDDFFNKIKECENSLSLRHRILQNSLMTVKKYDRKVFLKEYSVYLSKL